MPRLFRDSSRTNLEAFLRMLTPTLARGPRTLCALLAGLAIVALNAGLAAAQTFGFATMQPGTLNHTSGSAVAKVLKEKAGLNVVVQPTAGESVLIPLVSRGEAEFGIANILEVQAAKASAPNLRLIGSLHPLRGAFWVRKDSNMGELLPNELSFCGLYSRFPRRSEPGLGMPTMS